LFRIDKERAKSPARSLEQTRQGIFGMADDRMAGGFLAADQATL